jgi:4-amino-4-deoxy-L-arabinose transferase-like glycosyltransferase
VKKTSIILLAIVIAALAIRLIGLGTPAVRNDEGYSYFVAVQPFAQYPSLLAEDPHPPLFYSLLHVWAYADASAFWLRLLNVLLSVAAIPVIYLVGKELVSQRAGIIAAALLAISQVMLRYAQNLRMYPLLVLLVLLTAYFFLRWYRTMRARFLVGFIIFGALSLYTHYYSSFILLAMAVYVLVRRKLSWQFFFSCAAIIILFLPWLPIFAQQAAIKTTIEPMSFHDRLSWFGLHESNVFLRAAMIFFQFGAGYLKADFSSILFLALFLLAIIVFPFLIVKAITSFRVKKGLRAEMIFIVTMVIVPTLCAILVWGLGIVTQQTYARQVIVILPFYLLLLAAGLSRLNKLLWPAIVVILLLNAVAAYNYYVEDYHREDWRGAAQFIAEGSAPTSGQAPQSVILLIPDAYAHNFRYAYLGGIPAYGVLSKRSLAIGEFSQLEAMKASIFTQSCEYDDLVKGKDEVWFVQMDPGGKEDLFNKCRTDLEKTYVLAGSWKNTWHDIWGNSGVDLQVFHYSLQGKAVSAGAMP